VSACNILHALAARCGEAPRSRRVGTPSALGGLLSPKFGSRLQCGKPVD